MSAPNDPPPQGAEVGFSIRDIIPEKYEKQAKTSAAIAGGALALILLLAFARRKRG